jgi:hypothetical protein
MRRLLALALVLVPALCAAQLPPAARVDRNIVAKYQLDSATYIYCMTGPAVQGPGRVKTSGSSATVTAVAGLDDPFTNVAVGDELMFATGTALQARVVTARASATSITVDSVINLGVTTGFGFTYAHPACGTAVTDGWFIPGPGKHTITIVYRQGDLTGGLDFDIETRARGILGSPVQILLGNIPATTALVNGTTVVLGETTDSFRVGLRYNTADTSDAAANAEMIDVVLSTER